MTTYVGESAIPYAPIERPLYLKTTIQFESPIPVTREVHTAATQALMGDWANLAFEAVHEHDGAWVEEIAEYRAIAYEVPEEMDERLRWLLGRRRACRAILLSLPRAIARLEQVQRAIGMRARAVVDLHLVIVQLELMLRRIVASDV